MGVFSMHDDQRQPRNISPSDNRIISSVCVKLKQSVRISDGCYLSQHASCCELDNESSFFIKERNAMTGGIIFSSSKEILYGTVS
jgi:hypothetical protein